MGDVTQILSAIDQGDPHAAEQLLPLVYDESGNLVGKKTGPRITWPALRPRSRSMTPVFAWPAATSPPGTAAVALNEVVEPLKQPHDEHNRLSSPDLPAIKG
jgi:ECF sigma factor